jgi:hypothetical protein
MSHQHVVHFSVVVLGGAGVNAGAFGSGNTLHVAAADDHHSETAVAVMDRHHVRVGHVMQSDEEVMSALVRPGTDNSIPGGVRVGIFSDGGCAVQQRGAERGDAAVFGGTWEGWSLES